MAAASSKSVSLGKIAKFAPQFRYNNPKLEKPIQKHIVSEHNISCWLSNYVNNLFLTCCSFCKRDFKNWKFSFWNILTIHNSNMQQFSKHIFSLSASIIFISEEISLVLLITLKEIES